MTQAGGVVVKRDRSQVKFLVVSTKDDHDRWVLPKGTIEKHETAEETAVREVREESGVVARVLRSLGKTPYPVRGEERDVEFFLMEHVEDTPAEDDRAVAWLTYDDALDRLSIAEARAVLKKARSMVDGAW